MTTAGRSSDDVLPFMHLPKGRRLSREEVTKDELSHGCEQAHEQGSTGEGLELPSVLSSDAIALSDRLDGDIVLYFFFYSFFCLSTESLCTRVPSCMTTRPHHRPPILKYPGCSFCVATVIS